MLGGHLIGIHHTEPSPFHGEHVGIEDQCTEITALLHQLLKCFFPTPAHQGKRCDSLNSLLTNTLQVPVSYTHLTLPTTTIV